jgi:hypothetical protein
VHPGVDRGARFAGDNRAKQDENCGHNLAWRFARAFDLFAVIAALFAHAL